MKSKINKRNYRILTLIAFIPILAWTLGWFIYGVSLPNKPVIKDEEWVNIYIVMSMIMPAMYFLKKIRSRSWVWIIIGILFIVVSILFGRIAWLFISVGLAFMWYELFAWWAGKVLKKAELEYIRNSE